MTQTVPAFDEIENSDAFLALFEQSDDARQTIEQISTEIKAGVLKEHASKFEFFVDDLADTFLKWVEKTWQLSEAEMEAFIEELIAEQAILQKIHDRIEALTALSPA
jgi:DNA-binding transcriptional regulator PaaX